MNTASQMMRTTANAISPRRRISSRSVSTFSSALLRKRSYTFNVRFTAGRTKNRRPRPSGSKQNIMKRRIKFMLREYRRPRRPTTNGVSYQTEGRLFNVLCSYWGTHTQRTHTKIGMNCLSAIMAIAGFAWCEVQTLDAQSNHYQLLTTCCRSNQFWSCRADS